MIVVISKVKDTELKTFAEIVSDIRAELKENDIALEICKEHGFNADIIDGVSIVFEKDLDSSAKTIDSKIFLSTNLLDEDFEIIMRYAIHELVHALQHMVLEGIDPYSNEEYLDREDEIEAFQFQIAYDAEERGLAEAIDYAEDLVEYHEVPEEEQEDKKEELLEKV